MSEAKDLVPSNKQRLINITEVSHRTGLGKSTIWRRVAAGEFVRPIRVKPGITRWPESEIDSWINELVESAR